MNELELEKLKELAAMGNVNAINDLIDFYLDNNDVRHAKLELERLRFIHHPLAYRKLGYLFANGILLDKNIEKAKEYYQKAFDEGDDMSGYNMALILVNEKKGLEAIPYLTRGVSNNFVPSIKLLATLYLKGEVISKDLHIAHSLMKKVFELGEVNVTASLGKICYQMKNYEEAIKYFTLGVNLKDLDSMYYLGLCYALGVGVKQDLNKSKYYYEMGANFLEPRCLYNLSLYYRNGTAGEVNTVLADTLEKQAIENGFDKNKIGN